MSWRELETQIDLAEAGKRADPAQIQRLVDIVDMLVTYTKAQAASDQSSLLFCIDSKQDFQLDDIVSLVRHRARQQRAAGDAKVQLLLLEALQQTYPCAEETS